MIGRIVGGVLGSAVGRHKGNHPIAGAVIGAGTLFAARRLFPQRYAVIAATMAAGYLTKKWAERAEERMKAEEMDAAVAKLATESEAGAPAGADHEPTDGERIGDALPPAIPVDEDGHVASRKP